VEEAVISMSAISGTSHLSTMRFRGKIDSRDICTLLDSDSTYNPVNPRVLQGLNYTVRETKPL
jgi:hypothetical protein